MSSTSGRFVAPTTITDVSFSNPSISVRIWFRVCSLSSCPPPPVPLPLCFPMASISSMKIIAGALLFAVLKRSRTLLAPTPTNISTNSDPDTAKNGTLASPAIALAIMVFPVPGGPINKLPFGILAPAFWYFFGFFKKSTISCTSSLASSAPAMSVNLVLCFVLS